MNKLATVVVVLAAVLGIAVGLVLSSLTTVDCGSPLSLSTCFEVHRFSTGESAALGLLAAVVVGVVGVVLGGRLIWRSG